MHVFTLRKTASGKVLQQRGLGVEEGRVWAAILGAPWEGITKQDRTVRNIRKYSNYFRILSWEASAHSSKFSCQYSMYS